MTTLDDYATQSEAVEAIRRELDAREIPADHYAFAWTASGMTLLIGSVCDLNSKRLRCSVCVGDEVGEVADLVVRRLSAKCGCLDATLPVRALHASRKRERKEERRRERREREERRVPPQRSIGRKQKTWSTLGSRLPTAKELSLSPDGLPMSAFRERSNRSPLPKSKRTRIIARDGLICGICGGQVAPNEVNIDHILPVARGGSDDDENLQVAHRSCNMLKGAKAPPGVYDPDFL